MIEANGQGIVAAWVTPTWGLVYRLISGCQGAVKTKLRGGKLFSQTAEYALRAVAQLASCSAEGSTIPDIAEAIQVNVPYLRKVMNKLRDAGIVSAQRGTGGGIFLEVEAANLTMLDVVTAVDPIRHITSCPLGVSTHSRLCPLHSQMEEAIVQFEELLASRTIKFLISQKGSVGLRCTFPRSCEVYQL